jgi:hypothetical protein
MVEEENDMTTLIVIAAVVFVLYCFMAEWNCAAKHSPVIVTILCRLGARHIELAWKLFVGLIYFAFGMICIFEMNKKLRQPVATEGGFARFMDVVTTPVQLLVDGIVGLLGVLAVGMILGLFALKDSITANVHFWLGAVIVTYLLWLVVTICDLVEDEVMSSWTYTVSEEHGGEVAHRVLTKQDYVVWSAATFVIWIAVLATTGAWLSSYIIA